MKILKAVGFGRVVGNMVKKESGQVGKLEGERDKTKEGVREFTKKQDYPQGGINWNYEALDKNTTYK